MKKSPFLSRVLCALLPLLLPAPAAWGTGEASMRITIIPVAANDNGEVLFKTIANDSPYTHLTYLGNIRLGYLVVSGKGVWEEVVVRSIKGRNMDEDSEAQRQLAQKSHEEEIATFFAPIYWDSPSIKLRPLLEKYGFNQKDEVTTDLGKGKVEWRREGIFYGGKLIAGPIRQRTLFNNVSMKGRAGNPLLCRFFFKGVALFDNTDGQGAIFSNTEDFFPYGGQTHPFVKDPEDQHVMEDFDHYMIGGICIVPDK